MSDPIHRGQPVPKARTSANARSPHWPERGLNRALVPPSRSVDEVGPVDAPRILLVHGVAVGRGMWQPQTATFAATYRVLAMDLPGHGSRRGEQFTFGAAAAELFDLVESQPRHVILVGLSLGGYLALEAASKRPMMLAGLVLAGASADPRRRLIRILAGGVYPHLLRAVPERGAGRIQNAILRHATTPELAEALASGGFAYHTAARVYRQIAGRDYLTMARNVAVPTLVLNGQWDRTNRSDAATLVAALPDATTRIINKAGHAISMMQPQAFNQAILDFARRTLRGRRFQTEPDPRRDLGSRVDGARSSR